MNTLKSAALVIVCAAVCYGVYLYLTVPPESLSRRELDEMDAPAVEWDDEAPAGDEPPPSESPAPPPASADTPRDSIYGRDHVGSPIPSEQADENPAAPLSEPGSRGIDAGAVARTGAVSAPTLELPGAASPRQPFDIEAAKRRVVINTFRRDWEKARQQVDDGRFREALATLSQYHNQADLPPEEQAQLLAWLDALAAKVIYSREHLLLNPYKIRGSRTRMIDVAQEFSVTARLLQNINAEVVADPDVILPGTELKVVPGPFRAEVDLSRNEITVFLNELYAGRFPFSRGDEPVAPGQYQVQRIQPLPAYVSSDGRTVPGNDPANPYGSLCIHLGSEIRIHGSPLAGPARATRGCISLSPKDIEDLAGILTTRSMIIIR